MHRQFGIKKTTRLQIPFGQPQWRHTPALNKGTRKRLINPVHWIQITKSERNIRIIVKIYTSITKTIWLQSIHETPIR